MGKMQQISKPGVNEVSNGMKALNVNKGGLKHDDEESVKSLPSPQKLDDKLAIKFGELAQKNFSDQLEFFLKSFIFDLGDDWKEVVRIADEFKKYLDEKLEKQDLDAAQAADFLQRMGRTRTATQRRQELSDIDLDNNDRICLTEYLLLHFKVLILQAYFKRHDQEPTVSLDNEGVGLVGVGPFLLEELFTMPVGVDPAIEEAIEALMSAKKKRNAEIESLQAKIAAGGVKGLTAKAELGVLLGQDMTEMNRVEITLGAARRKATKADGSAALEKKKKQEEEEARKRKEESRARLANRAKLFES